MESLSLRGHCARWTRGGACASGHTLVCKDVFGVHISGGTCPVHWKYASSGSPGGDRHGRHAIADVFSGDQPAQREGAEGGAGCRDHRRDRHRPAHGVYRSAAGRAGAASGYAPDHVEWSSDPHAGRRANRPLPDGSAGGAGAVRAAAARSGHWCLRSTGSDAASWCWKTWSRRTGGSRCGWRPTATRIEVVKPLENALADGDDPIQGMVTGGMER